MITLPVRVWTACPLSDTFVSLRPCHYFVVVSMPGFNGSREEFVDLMIPFLDGEMDEKEATDLCDRLLKAFGKLSVVRLSSLPTLFP